MRECVCVLRTTYRRPAPVCLAQGRAQQHELEGRAAGVSALASGGPQGLGYASDRRRRLPVEGAAHSLLHHGPPLSPGYEAMPPSNTDTNFLGRTHARAHAGGRSNKRLG